MKVIKTYKLTRAEVREAGGLSNIGLKSADGSFSITLTKELVTGLAPFVGKKVTLTIESKEGEE